VASRPVNHPFSVTLLARFRLYCIRSPRAVLVEDDDPTVTGVEAPFTSRGRASCLSGRVIAFEMMPGS
jgi:hypothetical protein